jgi:hypothetical protein
MSATTKVLKLKQTLSLGLILFLGGCADTGDFGRPRHSVWNQTIVPTIGNVIARGREEAVSSFEFTDDEQELRDRAWRFLMPAHDRNYFDRRVAELAITRVLPKHASDIDKKSYRNALHRGDYRSQVPRYQRVAEDIQADRALLIPFMRVSHRVQRGDDIRCKALHTTKDVAENDEINALQRIMENNQLIAWVHHHIPERLKSYRYALERLVIETPSREAIMVERALDAFAQELNVLTAQHPRADASSQACDSLPSRTLQKQHRQMKRKSLTIKG